MYEKDRINFVVNVNNDADGHSIQNDEYMNSYVKYDEDLNQSHIYADLIGNLKNKTSEKCKSSEEMTKSSNPQGIQIRFCAISVLVAVFLSSGLTAVGFLFLKNLDNDKICFQESQTSSEKESNPNGNHAIAFLRSTCPRNWVDNGLEESCYTLNKDKKTWFQARDYCRDLGAELLSIRDNIEAATIDSYVKFSSTGESRQNYWIGLNALGEDDKFMWSDGSNSGFTRWSEKEPNNYNKREHCAEVTENNLWNDANCYLRRGFICKINFTDRCGDGDWLLFKDHCYFFGKEKGAENGTWDEAKTWCEKMDSNLVSIDSIEEHNFITNQIAERNSWIGLREYSTFGNYRWSDGNDTDDIPWGRGEPVENNKCVFIGNQYGNLISRRCADELNGYICEKHGR